MQVNGEPQAVPEGTTAAQLLERLKVTPERVVVELNLTILKRAQLPGVLLQPGDRIEIVQFVGGGSLDQRQETGDLRPDDQMSNGFSLMSPVSSLPSLRS